MTGIRRLALASLLLLAPLLAAPGCASVAAPDSEIVEPGDTFSFEGNEYRLLQVQEDYVLLRFREPGSEAGAISGFVDEVFRVTRYDLGQGRWYASQRLPGVYVQWRGLDAFELARGPSALRGAEVTMLK